MEEPAFEVFEFLQKNIPPQQIASDLSAKYDLSVDRGVAFVEEVEELIAENTHVEDEDEDEDEDDGCAQKNRDTLIQPIGKLWSEKYYLFNGVCICYKYYHHKLEAIFHPQMAHLEIEELDGRVDEELNEEVREGVNYFHLFHQDKHFYMRSDDRLIGPWGLDELHFFKGKVSAEFLDKVYHREERDWMGVFHASAVSDGKNAIIMPGESGSGKSTSLAILMAEGFSVMADDFVPVEAKLAHVRMFPAAISIKEGAWELVRGSSPDFGRSGEVYHKDASTRMIYLPPAIPADPETTAAPVKALVFVKYSQGAGLSMEEFPRHLAFQHLVTDSWISPVYENVESFLDWFAELPCYRLTYSDNNLLVSTIHKLFSDGL